MTLDSFSVLTTQQCFSIFFCSVPDTENNVQSFTEKLLSESVKEFTSTNFNSRNVIASFHIPSSEIYAKLTSCLSLHHFSNFP